MMSAAIGGSGLTFELYHDPEDSSFPYVLCVRRGGAQMSVTMEPEQYEAFRAAIDNPTIEGADDE